MLRGDAAMFLCLLPWGGGASSKRGHVVFVDFQMGSFVQRLGFAEIACAHFKVGSG